MSNRLPTKQCCVLLLPIYSQALPLHLRFRSFHRIIFFSKVNIKLIVGEDINNQLQLNIIQGVLRSWFTHTQNLAKC